MVLLSALALGCSAPPDPQPVGDEWRWQTIVEASELHHFPAARGILDGVEAPTPGRTLVAGDHVLFGLQLLDGSDAGEKAPSAWMLRVTALEGEIDVEDGMSLRIEVFDAEGKRLANESASVTKYLVRGVVRGCEPQSNPEPTAPLLGVGRERGDRTQALFATMDVLRLLQNSKPLSDILWQAVRQPSLLSMLGGVRVAAGMSFDHARQVQDPATGGSGYEYPLCIYVNRQVALKCSVTAVEPNPPLRVCGGITRLVGHDPHRAERRIGMQLLAARCVEGSPSEHLR